MLKVHSVVKQYKSVRAVDQLSFEVGEQEIFALLGPNGAGKTSMVRMLVGITRPDEGSISWRLGEANGRPQAQDIGYLPEERGLYKDVPVLRTLTYFGVLRGLPKQQATQAAQQWLERLELADRAQDKIDALSKGNQQKVQFIVAILHRPRFAILDEPFSGLDPLNQDLFLDLFRELRDAGMTILLCAHQMQLVERLADRMLLMNRGRQVLQGSMGDIKDGQQAAGKLLLQVQGRPALGSLRAHPAVAGAEFDPGGELTVLVRQGHSLSDLLVQLGSLMDIQSVRSERLSLHDIYVRAVEADSAPKEVPS